jgi:hypothetical protein
MIDATLSAFTVFFTQTLLFLAYQRTMEKSKRISITQTLFGVPKIPCDNHMRDLLDPLKPALVVLIFEEAFEMLKNCVQLKCFRGTAHSSCLSEQLAVPRLH